MPTGPYADGWLRLARPEDLQVFLASVGSRSDSGAEDEDEDDDDHDDDDDDSEDESDADSGDDRDDDDDEDDYGAGDDSADDREEDGGYDDDHGGTPGGGGTGGEPNDGDDGQDGGDPVAGPDNGPDPGPTPGPETSPSPGSPSPQTAAGAEPGIPVLPAERALALTPVPSPGGTLPRRALINDPKFEPYFENNVPSRTLKDILAYFDLTDRFAALQDDGTVDIVWLKFERRPTLKGLNVLIDGTRRIPDLTAAVGPLAVLIFRDQATLRQRSNVVPVFGNGDADTAAKATRRPLR